jgi:hypothetical protein
MADGRDVPDATFACPDLTTFTCLDELGLQHLTVARVADGLGVPWNTANDAILTEGRRHTRRGDKYVTRMRECTGTGCHGIFSRPSLSTSVGRAVFARGCAVNGFRVGLRPARPAGYLAKTSSSQSNNT